MSMSVDNEAAAVALAVDALVGLGLDTVTVDGDYQVNNETLAWTILAAAVPVVRADERKSCIEAARSVPDPTQALFSAGYRAGYAAARDEIIERIRDLPVRVAVDL